jgi:antitoxin ParD1/3/4
LFEKNIFIFYQILVTLIKIYIISDITLLSLGGYFESFVDSRVLDGSFKNKSDVILARLKLLENEENNIIALKSAIQEVLNSTGVKNFDLNSHLTKLKSRKFKDA